MPLWSKINSTTDTAVRPSSKRYERQKRTRRTPLPGFPIRFKFETKEQINNYFSGDRIQCLLCGKWFKCIGLHVSRIHEISEDTYREQYGLPWRRGLTSNKTHQKKRKIGKKRFKTGGLDYLLKIANKNREKVSKAPHRTHQPYHKKLLSEIQHLGKEIDPEITKKCQEVYDYTKKHKCHLNTALQNIKNPPGKTSFYRFLKRNPELKYKIYLKNTIKKQLDLKSETPPLIPKKQCQHCKNFWPITTDFFHKRLNDLSKICKACACEKIKMHYLKTYKQGSGKKTKKQKEKNGSL